MNLLLHLMNPSFPVKYKNRRREKLEKFQKSRKCPRRVFWLFFLPAVVFFPSEGQALNPPENLVLPSQLGSRTAEQIQSVFSSLEKTHSSDKAGLWLLKFQKARLLKEKAPEISCREMTALAEDKDFPLHRLALIYTYPVCPAPIPTGFFPERFPPYLRLALTRSLYKRAKKFQNQKLLLDTAEYLGTREDGKPAKISYLRHAVSLTKKMEDSRRDRLEKQLYELAPRLNPRPRFEDYLSIAHDYRSIRSFKKASYFYRKILNSEQASFEEKNTCFKWQKWIYKNRRNRKRYLQVSEQWSRFLSRQTTPQAQIAYHKNRLKLARDYWNLDQNEKALKILDQIPSSLQNRAIQSQTLWLKALIKEQKGLFQESLRELDLILKLFKRKRKITPFLESVLWKKAWILRQEGKWEEAVRGFTALVRVTQSPYLKARALYWKGETLWSEGRKVAGIKVFNRIIREYPFGYYGLLAHRRLNKTPDFQTNIMDSLSNMVTHINLNKKSLEIVRWLNVLKEKELSNRFLKHQETNLFRRKRQRRSDWLSFFSLHKTAGNHFNVFQLMGNLEPRLKKYFLKNHISLFFPRDYKKEILKSAEKRDLSKAMVFALIRQESAFNPRARSSSDAFGLMQLIPSTARAVARKIKHPYRGIGDLYQPETNIRLGTYYLKSLLQKYNNSFILATAAYNAGGTPVKKWRKGLNKENPLEFIENITYEETRTYVRLLIRNFIFYNKILNEEQAFFPEWIFHL